MTYGFETSPIWTWMLKIETYGCGTKDLEILEIETYVRICDTGIWKSEIQTYALNEQVQHALSHGCRSPIFVVIAAQLWTFPPAQGGARVAPVILRQIKCQWYIQIWKFRDRNTINSVSTPHPYNLRGSSYSMLCHIVVTISRSPVFFLYAPLIS